MPAPKVLIGPAPLKEIEPVYGQLLRAAGFELVFPKRNAQMLEAELMEQLPGCVASLAGSEPYTRAVIATAAAAGLKVICRAGVGYDGIDVQAATDHGIPITYAPGTNHDAVAEHVFGLILVLSKSLISQNHLVKAGQWPRRAQQPLRGRTLGILGLGRAGKAVALRGLAFGMPVIAHDPFTDATFAATHNIPMVSAEELFRTADFLSLHVPLTSQTKHVVNAESLGWMKPTAYLINTARGGVVHEADLFEALKTKRIAGAGLDVYEDEPPAGSPLLTLDNVVATAHTAGVDLRSRDDMARVPAEAIVKLFNGEWPTEWIVNPEVREKWEKKKASHG
ncbi:MAG: phosphoglycerate dehydrogenase [Fimbriiglobus sp.]